MTCSIVRLPLEGRLGYSNQVTSVRQNLQRREDVTIIVLALNTREILSSVSQKSLCYKKIRHTPSVECTIISNLLNSAIPSGWYSQTCSTCEDFRIRLLQF